MQKFRPTSWANLTYREVQRELAAQNSSGKYDKEKNSQTELEQFKKK